MTLSRVRYAVFQTIYDKPGMSGPALAALLYPNISEAVALNRLYANISYINMLLDGTGMRIAGHNSLGYRVIAV